MAFQQFNLHAEILRSVTEAGFTTPTPIQALAIPKVLEGKDLLASAQTGSGKTVTYLLPALHRLMTPSAIQGKGPRVLILVPTRELAQQVAKEATKYSKYLSRVKTVCIYGGSPYPEQNRQLMRHYEILVATPGRLIDHLERGRIHFGRLELLVLDEADRMLDMGFIDPVKQIAAALPKERQTVLFSATLKGSVLHLSKDLLNQPEEVTAESDLDRHEHIEQRLHLVDNLGHKNRILNHLLSDPGMNQAIVFTSTKRHADQLVDELYDLGYKVAALHGDMNQRQRTRTIKRLHEGEIKVLVATDVAARGIDVKTISHVINFDLPTSVEDYVHRIGRTGRAGSSGVALSFAAPSDAQLVKRIEGFTGKKITPHIIEGMEPSVKWSQKPARGASRTSRYSSSRGGGVHRKGGSGGSRTSNPSRPAAGRSFGRSSFGNRSSRPSR